MKAISLFSGFAMIVLTVSPMSFAAENPVTIPLKEIWAYEIPGTRDVRKLEADKSAPTTEAIRKALGPQPLDKPGPIKMPKPKRGFAVQGKGRDALRQAHSVLVDEKKPTEKFSAANEVTVIFTALQSEFYVELREVERVGNDFIIRFRFVPHEEEEVTEHFALIPLGKLPAGKYGVKFIQSPMERKYLDAGFQPVSDADARRIVCQSFSFVVVEQRETEAENIPLHQIWAYGMPGTRDIGELEPNKIPNYKYGPLVGEIRRELRNVPAKDKNTKAGFAVLGTGMDALREAHAVLVKNKGPRETFPVGSEISVVFFSHPFNAYVHVHEVEREGSVAKIHYRFVRHESHEETEHFALIPFGELPSGTFDIRIVQSPSERPVSDEIARRIVSRPFSFSVADGERK